MTKIIAHFDDTTGRANTRRAFVNGKAIEFPINTPFEASDELLAVLTDSDVTVTLLPEGGSSDAPAVDEGAAEDHGGAGGATPIEPEAEPEGEPEAEAEEAPAANPFDHDGDGKPGGSLPGAKATRTRKKATPKA